MRGDPFVTHRSLLFTVAYEMLGSAVDAEDVVQETWLKWADVDQADVRDPRAFLVRIVTRKALDRLRAVARRREQYVGQWLPEPLLTSPDVAEDAELADSLSMAMLLVLETLTPTERAVFVLREVFDLGYDELAEAVDKSPAAVRQIVHRARMHVAERRPRGVISRAETRGALEAFQRAIETGDLQGLVDILAPDVVALSDGGGGQAGTAAAHCGRRQGSSRAGCRPGRVGSWDVGRAGAGQRLAGLDHPARHGARQRRGDAGRGRPDQRDLHGPEPREAFAHLAGGCCQPLRPRRAATRFRRLFGRHRNSLRLLRRAYVRVCGC